MRKVNKPIYFKVSENTNDSWEYITKKCKELGITRSKTDLFETMVKYVSNADLTELQRIKKTTIGL